MATNILLDTPRWKRTFYVGLSLYILLIVLVGFWPSYFGAIVNGGADRPAVIHFHAVVYVGWLAIFVSQVVFAATGRIRLHTQLGTFAIGYGVLVILAGLAAAFGMFAIRVNDGMLDEAQASLLSPLLDMMVFTPFFAAAVLCRRKPVLHKRLMIVATTSLLIAAVGRMPFLGTPRNLWLLFLIWISPILLAMAYDLWRRRIVHPVYVAGIIVLALESPAVRGFLVGTDTWLDVTDSLARMIAA